MKTAVLNRHSPKPGSDRGMTLIDLCVFMIVLGLLTLPIVEYMKSWKMGRAFSETRDNNGAIDKAIGDFYYEHNRYPCPSDITLSVNNANYGRENCPVGTPGAGALHGGVPFADLKIPESATLDGWKNRIEYVVSDALRATPFNANAGALRINYFMLDHTNFSCTAVKNTDAPSVDFPELPVTPAPTFYLLLSHGATGAGAYSAEGMQVQPCPGAGTTLDAQNCIANTQTFFDSACAISDRPGPTFYDDIIFARNNPHSSIWIYNAADDTDIETMIRKVGINNPDPFPLDPVSGSDPSGVDVIGNVLATDDGITDPALDPNENIGTMNTERACDIAGQNCYEPDDIAGVRAELDCSNSAGTKAMGGVVARNAVCSETYSATAAGLCNPGKYAIGFDAAGKVRCTP